MTPNTQRPQKPDRAPLLCPPGLLASLRHCVKPGRRIEALTGNPQVRNTECRDCSDLLAPAAPKKNGPANAVPCVGEPVPLANTCPRLLRHPKQFAGGRSGRSCRGGSVVGSPVGKRSRPASNANTTKKHPFSSSPRFADETPKTTDPHSPAISQILNPKS
jgi:hypothetical protein